MPYQAVVTITGEAGSPAYQTFHFSDAETPDAIGEGLRLYANTLADLISEGAIITCPPTVRQIDLATGNVVAVEPIQYSGSAVVVAENGGCLPTPVQICVSLHTGYFAGGRELRGRAFIPYLGTNANTAQGLVNTGIAALALDAVDDLMGVGLGVYSPTLGRFELVTTRTLMSAFAVLRSRRD